MKYLYLKHLVTSLFILVFINLNAQQTIPATGGNVNGTGGSVSYSIGQVFYHTQNGSNGALAEGVLHPYISIVNTTTGTKDIYLSVLAYPNPATHILNLEVDNFSGGNMAYIVSDMNGKLLQHVRITGPKTTISMVHLPPSVYILSLVTDNYIIKTFRIIKK